MVLKDNQDNLNKLEHSGTRIQFIQQFCCTSCGSGGPRYQEIFKPTGQCNSCGAPAGKIELQLGERDVDLAHTVLAIHESNPSEQVQNFIHQLRRHRVLVISLADVLPPDQPVYLAVRPVEAIVKVAPYILAFWTPQVQEDALARLAIDAALLTGHKIVPCFPTDVDMKAGPMGLLTRAGTVLKGDGSESMMLSPERVIEQIADAMKK